MKKRGIVCLSARKIRERGIDLTEKSQESSGEYICLPGLTRKVYLVYV
jgi:hypothetical protein